MTNCKSSTGITVGLIDSLMSIATVLADRDLNDEEIIEALKDLRQDKDLRYLLEEYKIDGI